MKRTLCTLALTAIGTYGSLSAQSLDDQVLFTVEEDTVTAGEYMAVYNKNRDVGQDIDPKTPSEYLDLYINFKLKVHEAKELGMDTLPSFVREYQSYREQLTEPYLSDNSVTEELVREAYQRSKYDVKASHLMVKLPRNPVPADTLKAYQQIMAYKAQLDEGADFAELARKHSDDTYSAQKGGDLGYFTVFNMVYPFETAAYETEENEIAGPIRTQFGYHLVKPTGRREARGEITVAHIMLIANEKSKPEELESAEDRIREIYEKLEEGEEFSTLAKQYSEDKTSARMGGVLQSFGINKMYPEFEEAAFALQDSGDFSEPVKTPVGWHIIQVIKPYRAKDFSEVKEALQAKVERDMRARESRESVIKRLKLEYKYQEYPERYPLAFDQVDESLQSYSFSAAEPQNAEKVLFRFANNEYTVADYLQFLEKNQRTYGRSEEIRAQLYKAMNDYSREELIKYEKSRLPEKYPEFRMLDREYYEGILLFNLTDDKVWRAAVRDTTGLNRFYENNKSRYRWGKRIKAYRVDAADAKTASKVAKMLGKGKSLLDVDAKFNVESKLTVDIDSGMYEIAKLPEALRSLNFQEGVITEPVEIDGRYHVVLPWAVLPEGIKSLEETKGQVISDYQKHLEAAWLNELRDKYEVSINEEVLQRVIEELEREI